jgi:RNA polymerase sigma-70 factor (ECF subfamily)
MAELSTDAMARPLEVLFREGTLGGLSDAQLLERFLASGAAAGAAFDVLVARHGPMVLEVCRRILRDVHAADDSFQATFLVLVRRAGAIRRRESLGPWLHGVARRVALRARADALVRQEREARAAIDPETALAEPDADDLGPALHDEIGHLPEKYRAPIVLCYLQGRTIEEASRQLGWPAGTVGGRLARARDQLRDRLVRRGLVAPAALAAVLARDPASAAAVPRALARSTREAALQLAAGKAAATVVSAIAVNLLEGTLRAMGRTRLMTGAGIYGMLGALAIGTAGMSLTAGVLDDRSSPQPPARTKAAPGPGRPAGNPLVATLDQASLAAADLTDPQEKVDAHMALAWAFIKSGHLPGARANLDRAEEAAKGLEPESRCYARVRIAQARGEVAEEMQGLDLLAVARVDAERLGDRRVWPLKDLAVAQSQLGDRAAARATIQALDLAILSPEDRRKGRWTSAFDTLAEAQLVVGDVEEAFRTCITSFPRQGGERGRLSGLHERARMLTHLASVAADDNHQSRAGIDPARPMTADEKAARLAIVRRAVAAVEALPDPNEHRPSLATSLGQLGAFDEAVQVARRIDQKEFQQPGQIDATWALWRIGLDQSKAKDYEGARATLREALRVPIPPKADAQETRGMLAHGFVVARAYDEALKIAETLDPGGRASVFSQVARHKRLEGDRAGAEALFRRALREAGEFLHSPPPPEPPGPVPAAGGGGSDGPGAADPKARHQAEGLTLLAEIHARAGDWASAERTFAFMSPEDRQSRVAALRIAMYRSHSGDVAGALAWSRSLPSGPLRAWALRGLAVGIFGEEEGME